MKKFLLLLCLLITQLTSMAYDFCVDGIYYHPLTETTVEVIRNARDLYNGEILSIPAEVTDGRDTYSVTAIGERAFADCSNITSATIPSSIVTIGQLAFYNCKNLVSLTLEDGANTLSFDETERLKTFGGTPIEILYLGRTITQQYFDYSPFMEKESLTSVTIGSMVTVIPANAFYECNGLTAVSIPNNVKTIEGFAFAGCPNLTKLTIEDGDETLYFGNHANCTAFGSPCSELYIGRDLSFPDSPFAGGVVSLSIGPKVTEIKSGTFNECPYLNIVEIKDGNNQLVINDSFKYAPITSVYVGRSTSTSAFSGKSTLESVTVGNLVTWIGTGIFSSCDGLKNLTIEDGDDPLEFYDSENSHTFSSAPITTLYLGRNLSYNYNPSWHAYSPFKNASCLTNLTIGDKVTEIGREMFQGCKALNTVLIPENVTTIEDGAFYECTGLSSAIIKSEITDIPYNTFKRCSNLESLILPSNSITRIGSNAFDSCSKLSSITVSGSVKEIGSRAFYKCSELMDIIFQDDETTLTIEYDAFGNCGTENIYLGRNIKGNVFSGSSLKNLTIGDNVTEIGDNAFVACESLASVTFPQNITTIGENAFSKCLALASVDFPNSLTKIADGAFNGCEALTSLIIPEHVERVGYKAFYDCDALLEVRSENPVPPMISSSSEIVFGNNTYNNGLLFVPAESIQKYYRASNWHLFANIKAIPVSIERIVLSPESINAKVGETIAITASIFPENATDKSLTWTSSDENIASVDSNGTVTIKGIGSTEIIVSSNDGSGVSATLAVTGIPTLAESITISAEGSTSLKDTQTVQLRTTILPETTTDKNVIWQSSDIEVASVDENGLVTAHAKIGKAEIAAICGGVSATIEISVIPTPIESIAVNPDNLSLAVGETSQLTATVLPENATDMTLIWTSSNPEVATVSTDGLVTAIGEGEATISATSQADSSIFATGTVKVESGSGISSVENDGANLNVIGQSLVIEGSEAKVQIITVDGRCIYSGHDRRIELQNGIYIVILGNHVTKIVI